MIRILISGVVIALIGCASQPTVSSGNQKANIVQLVETDGRVAFLRDGLTFTVRGAGGPESLQKLAEAGGNSIRTWGIDQLEDGLLDEAHGLGLSVSVGIWLRHDLDYNDEQQVSEQIRRTMDGVRRYKDHPAILLWGVGNEMEGDGSRAVVWQHIELLAAMIKAEDPSHPTMTVIAEIGGDKVRNIHELCPSIDIVGINSYGGASTLPQRYREAGGAKPYILAEYGPLGPWDLGQNSIGSFDERLGSQKAETYLKAYRVNHTDALCLGSYAFLWGYKQEATPTWFGMFLQDGRRTPVVDVLTQEWSGKPPANQSPRIVSLKLEGTNTVKAKAEITAVLRATDPEGDHLKVEWVLMEDSESHLTSGYFQETPPGFEENILEASNERVTFKAPNDSGLYRIFAYVGDGVGAADAANVVFRVAE